MAGLYHRYFSVIPKLLARVKGDTRIWRYQGLGWGTTVAVGRPTNVRSCATAHVAAGLGAAKESGREAAARNGSNRLLTKISRPKRRAERGEQNINGTQKTPQKYY
jgi:hypothetical protein